MLLHGEHSKSDLDEVAFRVGETLAAHAAYGVDLGANDHIVRAEVTVERHHVYFTPIRPTYWW